MPALRPAKGGRGCACLLLSYAASCSVKHCTTDASDSNRIRGCFCKVEAQLIGQTLRSDAVERREVPRAELGGSAVAGHGPLHACDHEILRRVLSGDELEHLRFVASPLQ